MHSDGKHYYIDLFNLTISNYFTSWFSVINLNDIIYLFCLIIFLKKFTCTGTYEYGYWNTIRQPTVGHPQVTC